MSYNHQIQDIKDIKESKIWWKFQFKYLSKTKLWNLKFCHFANWVVPADTFLTKNPVNVMLWPWNFVNRFTLVHIYGIESLKKQFQLFIPYRKAIWASWPSFWAFWMFLGEVFTHNFLHPPSLPRRPPLSTDYSF